MSSYLVTYDLSAPGRKYDALHEYLKGFGTWAHISESSWVVVSSIESSKAICDGALQHLDSNDKIFVLKLDGQGAWSGAPTSTSDWLKKNL